MPRIISTDSYSATYKETNGQNPNLLDYGFLKGLQTRFIKFYTAGSETRIRKWNTTDALKFLSDELNSLKLKLARLEEQFPGHCQTKAGLMITIGDEVIDQARNIDAYYEIYLPLYRSLWISYLERLYTLSNAEAVPLPRVGAESRGHNPDEAVREDYFSEASSLARLIRTPGALEIDAMKTLLLSKKCNGFIFNGEVGCVRRLVGKLVAKELLKRRSEGNLAMTPIVANVYSLVIDVLSKNSDQESKDLLSKIPAVDRNLLKVNNADVQQARAFKRIYRALRVGQSSLFKTNFLMGKEALSPADFMVAVRRHAENNPASRTAEAFRLTDKYLDGCGGSNVELCKEIYSFAYAKSSLFARSGLSAANMNKLMAGTDDYKIIADIDQVMMNGEPNTRRGKIRAALGEIEIYDSPGKAPSAAGP